MSQESSFIVSPEDIARVERQFTSPKEMMWSELTNDYHHYFSHEGKIVAKKILDGKTVSRAERGVFDRERNLWWKEKYGFPFELSAERDEVLARKYTVGEDLSRRRNLQVELFAAVRDNNPEILQQLRNRYESEYPDQLEGVDVLTEFPSYVALQEKIKNLPRWTNNEQERAEKKRAFQSLTEYHFLVSHFVEQNSDDKKFLETFWGILEELGATMGNLRQAQMMRGGVLSQVAAYKIFDQLGLHPKLSHPDQDAFDAIDMWMDGDVALQIKTGPKPGDELLRDAEEVAFPGVQMSSADDSMKIVNTDLMQDISRFRAKTEAYGARVGKKVLGYYAVIPKQTYDHVTGIPSKEIIQRFAEKLGISLPVENQEVV